MKNTITFAEPKAIGNPLKDVQIGEAVLITDTDSSFDGHILLRYYGGWTSLTDPNHTWDSTPDLVGRKLAPGTVVTLTFGSAPVAINLEPYQKDELAYILRGGNKINAIKYVRQVTLAGLREAKEYVDNFVY